MYYITVPGYQVPRYRHRYLVRYLGTSHRVASGKWQVAIGNVGLPCVLSVPPVLNPSLLAVAGQKSNGRLAGDRSSLTPLAPFCPRPAFSAYIECSRAPSWWPLRLMPCSSSA